MFQFRRFPTYYYFIHSTLTEYCSAGFPHSEISGSMRMCRSPELIAACHVLLRLPVPRHSPCALFSLTIVGASSLHCASVCCTKAPYPLPCSSSSSRIFDPFGVQGTGGLERGMLLLLSPGSQIFNRIMQATLRDFLLEIVFTLRRSKVRFAHFRVERESSLRSLAPPLSSRTRLRWASLGITGD